MDLIRIVLVDDHKLLLSSMKVMLEKEDFIEVVGKAYNGKDFLEMMDNIEFDMVLMDIDMPGMNGIEAARGALSRRPDIKIITVSMFDDFDNYNQVIEAGVHGFVVKNAEIRELLEAIYSVWRNEKYFSPQLLENAIEYMSNRQDKSKVKYLLSKREMQVLKLISEGLSSNEIAANLDISPRTVEKHRDALLKKTKSKNAVTLAVFASKHGLLD
ncbi:Response regulator UvrY [Salinivirga cyanobacteriivorans]|uniref:Response regulator UvrY n=1 Tax=Salinivirga cyanobacteriivorans TaxID=1307839 RepID=A0A0S2I377_9BACT|nr:response regulator transcription factor [Salinivirga cyanobacteriivorans]ALO16769.1 Response regulator UvrY [Salinivirga cyanobacteriivorans]